MSGLEDANVVLENQYKLRKSSKLQQIISLFCSWHSGAAN